jgi:hypothetical protein
MKKISERSIHTSLLGMCCGPCGNDIMEAEIKIIDDDGNKYFVSARWIDECRDSLELCTFKNKSMYAYNTNEEATDDDELDIEEPDKYDKFVDENRIEDFWNEKSDNEEDSYVYSKFKDFYEMAIDLLILEYRNANKERLEEVSQETKEEYIIEREENIMAWRENI